MKLDRKKMLLISFMLFSLFFGAGNLIFPPFLGQNAGSSTVSAMLGFLATAVILPVLGVIVVARFDGLEQLAQHAGKKFSLIFTVLIYLSIGPGLGIPRAASVPFEMAVAPYLPQDANIRVWMVVYSLVFFLIALWLCMTPGKLVSRIGNFLTPSLLILLVFLFISFLFRGQVNIAAPQTEYSAAPFLKGFSEGYQTMDTIAALNFGLVIATTLGSFGLTQRKDVLRHTVKAGLFAGLILSAVYMMLSYMGMCSSGVYDIQENGAWTLRCIVFQLFGEPGAYLLAAIFTLACLTTCVGLINSISQYFSHLFSRISYRKWVFLIYWLFLPDLQSGSDGHFEHFHPDFERHLSDCDCADSAGHNASRVGKEPLCLPDCCRRDGRRQRAVRAGHTAPAAGHPRHPLSRAAAV